ncbi:PREDICTED: lysophospholipid acyltransferase 5 [Ceratosolen solmsi marchali]|uniref:Lysophospholipid acyltransferase 5 n=1 Tax=Ceratosolen solmsi marchali TaxID=326594 RepID=A0AAJ7DWM2_9HYME|nr:PREDICTED: lysophospholipid acyltransferase 5 [Ceratosolen solmsi marchali]
MASGELIVGGLESLADIIGVPTDALRLLISLFLGFPLALFHREILYGKNPTIQHYYFIICGLVLGFWNYEWSILHSIFTLLITYGIFSVFGNRSSSVVATFIFNMGYLLCGYYATATDDYDIKWTMPQCVLTLRLIGLSFNLADSTKPEDKLSDTQKTTMLHEKPSLLEMTAFVYFPGSFLIGPQFSMRRYLDYVNGKLMETKLDVTGLKVKPNSLMLGINRALIGIVYAAMYKIGTQYVSNEYLTSSEYDQLGIIKRCFFLGLWGRCTLYKYISCWLITEGVCIVFGITYNGKDEHGCEKWDGCANVNLLTFENATEFNHYIMSFNINTNYWCSEYIYKRLKFLGSKVYSQIVTLLFLAIWHGLHSGYYLCFFQEFIIMYLEKDLKPVLVKNETLQKLMKENFLFKLLIWSILKIYTFVFMGYSLIPFTLLSYSRYVKVYRSVYFIGHIIFLSYPLLAPFIKRLIRPHKKRSQTD